MKKGKLIVLEGTDGSGKATQTKLLIGKLAREGYSAGTMSFPRYEGNVFGELIGECLSGGRGDFLSLDPRITAVLYAGDRFESKGKLEQLLAKNDVVVLDRYVSSNQIHQSGRIDTKKDRLAFLRWLDNLEYNLFELPRPDLVFFLDVPPGVSMEMTKKAKESGKKVYLKKNKDVYEEDRDYNQRSHNNAKELLEIYPEWRNVNCTLKNEMRARDEINKDIWKQVQVFVS